MTDEYMLSIFCYRRNSEYIILILVQNPKYT